MSIYNADFSDFLQTIFHMSWYEIGMLACFGASWPFSIHKMLRTGRSDGKSLVFLVLVMIGYIFSIIHKLFYNLDIVIILYALLMLVVLADALICIHLRRKNSPPKNKKIADAPNGSDADQ